MFEIWTTVLVVLWGLGVVTAAVAAVTWLSDHADGDE